MTTAAPAPVVGIGEILDAAACYLDTHGWHQGDLYNLYEYYRTPFPKACAIGAIRLAAHGSLHAADDAANPHGSLAVNAAIAYLAVFLDDGEWPEYIDPDTIVGDWNDAPGRTRDQVTTTLRRVAASYRQTREEVS